MFTRIIPVALLALAANAVAIGPVVPATPPVVGFSILKTASLSVKEGMVYSGGSFVKDVDTNFSAFLIKDGDHLFLFDTGLGRHVAEQYRTDMPLWQRPFFKYDEPVSPAHDQLDKAGVGPIEQIILSHSHWDHASAIEDFPGAQVWIPQEEMEVIRHPQPGVGGAWPSQIASPSIRWAILDFKPVPYEGFERSLDLYQDGKVVLVPLFGHTPGSIGMFLNTDSGNRYFFCGDAVWKADALKSGSQKFWAARLLVDHDTEQTQKAIDQIRGLAIQNPDLIVVPAHDGSVQKTLGYFPEWVK